MGGCLIQDGGSDRDGTGFILMFTIKKGCRPGLVCRGGDLGLVSWYREVPTPGSVACHRTSGEGDEEGDRERRQCPPPLHVFLLGRSYIKRDPEEMNGGIPYFHGYDSIKSTTGF